MCWNKEREMKKTKEVALRVLKNETDVWKFLNRSRVTKLTRDNDISLSEWKKHFRLLLNGAETMMCGEKRVFNCEDFDSEEIRLKIGEVRAAIKSLKRKKACGFDGVPSEALIYSDNKLYFFFVNLIERIRNGDRISDD